MWVIVVVQEDGEVCDAIGPFASERDAIQNIEIVKDEYDERIHHFHITAVSKQE